ncbi:MAG: adenylosuccinate synthetase [Firmicutes bacterium]|nr:adenylosuccinate synthetase [Bacillota bacterium]
MKIKIIIGKNFGDEGKGLAVNYFAQQAKTNGLSCICVRHNGGAQAGHTVDLKDKRFVFSQLSSASFCGFPTYWADSFLPDMFKLAEEAENFKTVSGFIPEIYADKNCRCTYIDDILINMALETARGDNRHGSCGMGINEAVLRSEKAPLYLGDIAAMDADTLYKTLSDIRGEYTSKRLAELSPYLENIGGYGEMLKDKNVLFNAAKAMCDAFKYIKIRPLNSLLSYDKIIFEGAQGLMLDEFNLEYAPHLTSSRTGLYEPARLINALFKGREQPETEVIYISRTYITRHGQGRLLYENLFDPAVYGIKDKTNVKNEWQGELRFAPHGDTAEFTAAVKKT